MRGQSPEPVLYNATLVSPSRRSLFGPLSSRVSHPNFLPAKVTLHITTFEGSSALSNFRAQRLQSALEAIHPRITGIAARFVHLVATDVAPTAAEHAQLAALLTYGEAYAGPAEGPAIVVTPRLSTVSPWAS